MNLLFHKLNQYEGWEKYWEQSVITGEANNTCSIIRCKIFHEKVSFFGRKKKVSEEFGLQISSYDPIYLTDKMQNYANSAHKNGQIWKEEISKWVKELDIDEKGSMIELAEMALVTTDPYVKDAFITKWLSKVKPIKERIK